MLEGRKEAFLPKCFLIGWRIFVYLLCCEDALLQVVGEAACIGRQEETLRVGVVVIERQIEYCASPDV